MLNMTSSDLFFTKQLELKYMLTKMLFVGRARDLKLFVKGIEVLTYNFVITLKKRDKVLLRILRGSSNIDLAVVSGIYICSWQFVVAGSCILYKVSRNSLQGLSKPCL